MQTQTQETRVTQDLLTRKPQDRIDLASKTISTETATVVIEVSGGCLTIGEHLFPDNCISLSVQDTQQVLEAILTWKYGLQEIPGDEEDAQ